MSQADDIVACRARYLKKLAESGRTQVPRGKSKRRHPKRHGENEERSCIARRKAAKAKDNQAASLTTFKRHCAIERAYWRGETDDLSDL